MWWKTNSTILCDVSKIKEKIWDWASLTAWVHLPRPAMASPHLMTSWAGPPSPQEQDWICQLLYRTISKHKSNRNIALSFPPYCAKAAHNKVTLATECMGGRGEAQKSLVWRPSPSCSIGLGLTEVGETYPSLQWREEGADCMETSFIFHDFRVLKLEWHAKMRE